MAALLGLTAAAAIEPHALEGGQAGFRHTAELRRVKADRLLEIEEE